jgi:hypothetical protein
MDNALRPDTQEKVSDPAIFLSNSSANSVGESA